MPYGLKDSVIKKLQNTFEVHWKVETIVLFGSRAKGNYRPGSDIDLAVKSRNFTFQDNLSLSAKLDDLNLPYKIDLINYATIKDKDVIEHIDRVGVVFYKQWKEHRLGDFIDVKHGFAFKGKFISTELTNNILVTPGNFHIGGGFKQDKFKYYNGDYPDEYILSEGDVVITMTDLSQETDTLGYSAKIPKQNGFKFLHNQRIGLVNVVSNKADKEFIYWLLRTDEYHGFIVGSASGTSIMHTSPSRIKEYSFFLPPLSDQTAIASVLSSLDDKIDLLHRQDKTLEQLAETLFRQWFVEEAEEGWEVKSLDEIADYLNGLACQKYPPKNAIDKLPVIKIKEMKSGFTENSDWATSDVPTQYIVEQGDVLFSWSGSLKVEIWVYDKGVLNQHLFKVTSEKYPKWFYYFATRHHLEEFRIIAESKTTTMGHIQRKHLSEAKIKVPPKEVMTEMDKQVSPIFQRIIANQTQICTITQLRDTLLPKLMSGEVRVKM